MYMKYRLLYSFRTELMEEAKRLVDITYKADDFMFFDTDKFEKELNKKYIEYKTSINLLLIGLCSMKNEGEDYSKETVDYDKLVEHYERYIPYKEEKDNISFSHIANNIVMELLDNYKKYSGMSLFEYIPKMANKFMKCHNDSVDHEAIVMVLEEELKKFNKKLENNNLNSLVNI